MAKDYTLPKEPECHPIQYPGPPVRVGDGYGHIVSTKINPDSVVPPSREPDAPKNERY